MRSQTTLLAGTPQPQPVACCGASRAARLRAMVLRRRPSRRASATATAPATLPGSGRSAIRPRCRRPGSRPSLNFLTAGPLPGASPNGRPRTPRTRGASAFRISTSFTGDLFDLDRQRSNSYELGLETPGQDPLREPRPLLDGGEGRDPVRPRDRRPGRLPEPPEREPRPRAASGGRDVGELAPRRLARALCELHLRRHRDPRRLDHGPRRGAGPDHAAPPRHAGLGRLAALAHRGRRERQLGREPPTSRTICATSSAASATTRPWTSTWRGGRASASTSSSSFSAAC